MKNNNETCRKCVQLFQNTPLSDRQYADIAKLVFDTDPYIYPAMFGEGEEGVRRAIAILPAVFECGQDAMFKKENLFVLEEDEQITGLILWCSGALKWDTASLLKIAERKGLPLNAQNIELVRKEYVEDCYAEEDFANDRVTFLINVCIEKEKRGTGRGSFLLKYFVQAHAGEPMELTALSDNLVAIRLYQKYGFYTTREYAGFAPGPEKPMCVVMQRDPTAK